jgi:hypothetical protein
MRVARYAVVRVADSDDDAEAFGPFTTVQNAERFRQDYQEHVSPGYEYVVVELYPVRDGQRQIREEREAWAE